MLVLCMKVASALEGLKVPLEFLVWTYDTLDNNFGITLNFDIYLKEYCFFFLNDISPSTIVSTLLSSKRFHLSCPAGMGINWLTLMLLRLLSSNAQKRKKNENHLNPIMLVFIGKPSWRTIR